ncbi:MAG: universal stress protein [Saprospiraceae bacterium]|nr:universal stress protein [Saprospiraceae bacterium]
MKNILVPTDFSAFAKYAFDAAVLFAKRFNGCRIHLLHQLPPPTGEATPKNQQAEENALVLLSNLKNQQPDLDIRTNIIREPLTKSIQEFVERHGIELIIMGSHGSSGANELFIGSNTQKVVRGVRCPVLVLKQPLENIKFDRVIYASNFHQDDTDAFLKFKAFVAPFIPEIHLVEVHTSSLFDPPYFLSKESMERFQKLAEPFECEAHIQRDFSIEKGIRAFAESLNADLIAISNHNRHPVKRIFSGSNVEALVNHANTPVLSIDYQKES